MIITRGFVDGTIITRGFSARYIILKVVHKFVKFVSNIEKVLVLESKIVK